MILLEGLRAMGASPAEAGGGLMAAALAMGLAGIGLSLATRMPVSVAWSTPGAALLAVTATPAAGYAEAVGAFAIAGLLTLAAGLAPLLARAAQAIPPALAQAMLAGVLIPICLVPAREAAAQPGLILPIVAAFLLAGLAHRLAAVPAAVAATAALIWTGAPLPAIAAPPLIVPAFSLQSALSLALPLFIVTMATQNIPGLAVLRSFGYTPPPGRMLAGVGAMSVLSAPFGAPQTCLAAITAAMCASPESHPDPGRRYASAVWAGAFYCLLGLFAIPLAAFAVAAPQGVLGSLAGLALIGVLAGSAKAALDDEKTRLPATLTLVTTASGLTAFGLGAAVWGLALGLLVHAAYRLRAN